MNKNAIFIALFFFVFFVLYSLLTGQSYLLRLILGDLPLGNLLTAFGLCAAAGAGLTMHERNSKFWTFSLLTLILAMLWLPIAVYLAGNLELNFNGQSGQLMGTYTGVTILFAFIILLSSTYVFIGKIIKS